ncbi:MAG: hypothetical protein OER21_12955, partial [Gemmatimonadota bacterium]|nr:hypothetical protein [Gemmatimonadota bacterium]
MPSTRRPAIPIWLAVTLLGGVASPVVAQQPLPPPGEPIRNPAWQPSAAADQCLVLPRPAPRS